MSADADSTAALSRDEEILDELAELGLALARGLQARALAAEAPQEAGQLSMAFQRVARSVRQALALKGRLRRDEMQDGRQLHHDAQAAIRKAIYRRKARVLMWMHRAIADETPMAEEDLASCRLADLHERLHDDMLDAGFLDAPFEAIIAELCRVLGLPIPDFQRPPTDEEPPDDEPAARRARAQTIHNSG